jgi:glutamate synthase (NADPH/NADH) large chain
MGNMLFFDAERLRILIERHRLLTDSEKANALLDDWETTLSNFVKVVPKDYRRALLEMQAEREGAVAAAAQ